MKFDYLALIITLFFGVLILIFPPFVASVYVPLFIRFPLLFIVSIFFLLVVIKQKKFILGLTPFIGFFLLEVVYWVVKGNNFIGEITYFIIYIVFSLSLLIGAKRIKGGKELICNFYFLLVITFSVLAIISFLAFNLDLISYTLKPVGEEAFYNNYHHPILGYISIKRFEFGTIGRVCGYFFEPSYLGWFLTVNFFIVEKFLKNPGKRILFQFIVFLGALATCSTMAWVVFPFLFLIRIFYKILELMKISTKLSNIIFITCFVVGLVGFVALVPKQALIENLGTSSADDREDRVGVSFLILANSSLLDLLFGRSPGYIEKNFDKGESNQLIKLVVETGLISTVLILAFVVFCTSKSKYFMIANLLFLNSVVILFTPLFIINLLICKWKDES